LAAVASDEGSSFFGPISSPETLANWDFLESRSDPYAREARAYSLVASGRLKEGVQALRELAASLTNGNAWMLEIHDRALQLATLAETRAEEAHELLRRWETETATTLRVESFP
jgi:hypothetical protein